MPTSTVATFPVPSSVPFQPVSDRFPALEEQEVEVTFFSSTAQRVAIAGNFNSWSPDANRLDNLGAGQWRAFLALKAGQYEYRFVVDGVWTDDPQATERVANPHGGFNAILRVGLDDRIEQL